VTSAGNPLAHRALKLGGQEPDKREIEIAHKLVQFMDGKHDMTEFQDTYRDRVLARSVLPACDVCLRPVPSRSFAATEIRAPV